MSLNPFRVLVQHRNFRIFWLGQTLSLMGTWMQTMAQGWLALELTNDALLVGLVTSVGALPILLFSFLAGVVVDRVDRLRLVKAMQALMLLEATALCVLTLTRHISIGSLLALAFANGVFSAFEIPARQSLIIELVGRDDLHEAIALNSSGFNLARIVGPAIGAAVIAVFGLAWCFGINALSYLAVLVGLFLIRIPAHVPTSRSAPALAELVEGFRYIWRTPRVRALMGVVLVFSVAGTPYLTLLPVVARDLLGLGAAGYGVLLSSVGIGGLAGALFLAAVGGRLRRERLLVVASVGFAVLLVGLAFVRTPGVARLVLLATGCTMILNGALANGILQTIVPDGLRGRVMAVYSFIVVGMAQVVGALVGGAVARVLDPRWAIGGGGAAMLAYAAWAFGRWDREPAAAVALRPRPARGE